MARNKVKIPVGITSYAQNFEDVMLARCFPGKRGFYVDVGANDPDIDNVTRVFYERGWSGINIEPLNANFNRLKAKRPRDINLKLCVGDRNDAIIFYEVRKWHGYSTTDAKIAAEHKRDGLKVEEHSVPLLPLKEVLDRYAAGKKIDFLKIDVEGTEMDVMKGCDFSRHRPKIVLLESKLPVTIAMINRVDEVPDRAEDYARFLAPHGYRQVYHDGLNAYFVAKEHAFFLTRHFTHPPGIFDRFIHAASIRPFQEKLAKLKGRKKPKAKKKARKS